MTFTELRPGERVKDVRCDADSLIVDLLDGRTISVPLAWYPRLFSATAEQRERWEVSGAGYGIHWPEIDEDLSVAGLLVGSPSGEFEASPRQWIEEQRKALEPRGFNNHPEGYLQRAKERLAEGTYESLIYAALELRTGIETRLRQYVTHQKHVSKKLRQGYEIPKLGKAAEKAFNSGDKVGRFTFYDGSEKCLATLYYTPVTKSLRDKAGRLGGYLHSLDNRRVQDPGWWNDLGELLRQVAQEFEVVVSGTLLGMPLQDSTGRLEMPLEWDSERPMKQVVPGEKVKIQIEYLDEIDLQELRGSGD